MYDGDFIFFFRKPKANRKTRYDTVGEEDTKASSLAGRERQRVEGEAADK